MADVQLLVGDRRHGGWTSMSFTRSIEELCAAFQLGVKDFDQSEAPFRVVEGDPCELRLGGVPVLAGYVDDRQESYDATSHSVGVSGRSRTGDLVDCGAVPKGSQFRNKSLLEIAHALCGEASGFGIRAGSQDPDAYDPITSFTIEPGEKVHEALDRVARTAGLLLTCDALGNIVFTRAGQRVAATTLQTGVNIVSAAYAGSWKDRHSSYTVKANAPGGTYSTEPGAQAARGGAATVSDSAITRYRPIVVVAECGASPIDLKRRAEWERAVRAGRSQRVTYTVRGWLDSDDTLWAPNVLVPVYDSVLGIDAQLLLSRVTLKLDDQGEHAELELMPPSAFAVEPPKRKKSKHGDFTTELSDWKP